MTEDKPKLHFEEMTPDIIGELTKIMKRAFNRDAQIHLGVQESGPDGYDDGRFLTRYGLDDKSDAYSIYLDGKLAGGAIIWPNSHGEYFLGTIFLDTDRQNQGLGLRVWQKIESIYPDAVTWKTETPAFSRRNHYFYVTKCGFHIVHIQKPSEDMRHDYYMEKKMR